MSEWRQQLDRAERSVANNAPADAFLKAFGALEICFGAVAQRLEKGVDLSGDDRFARMLRILVDHKTLNHEERLLAKHIADARNCVAHRFSFEPSALEVRRTIKNVERLCSKFGRRAYDVMVKPVLTAKPDDHIGRFVPRIVEDGISHIPVVGKNRLLGTLRDVEVLKAWERGEGILDPNTPVEQLMSDKVLPDVKSDLSIEEVRKVMLREKTVAVLILHTGLPQGIITRFDLLEHVGTYL